MSSIAISGGGMTGTLRLTWVRDKLSHVIEHAGNDEPTGTWTGLACPERGLPIGSDVELQVLKNLCARGEIADVIWEAPGELIAEHDQAYQAAILAYKSGDTHLGEQEWDKVKAGWSRGWAANRAALQFMQEVGVTRFSPVKPQRWVVASFGHHCGLHGARRPHIHNIVMVALTAGRVVLGDVNDNGETALDSARRRR